MQTSRCRGRFLLVAGSHQPGHDLGRFLDLPSHSENHAAVNPQSAELIGKSSNSNSHQRPSSRQVSGRRLVGNVDAIHAKVSQVGGRLREIRNGTKIENVRIAVAPRLIPATRMPILLFKAHLDLNEKPAETTPSGYRPLAPPGRPSRIHTGSKRKSRRNIAAIRNANGFRANGPGDLTPGNR